MAVEPDLEHSYKRPKVQLVLLTSHVTFGEK